MLPPAASRLKSGRRSVWVIGKVDLTFKLSVSVFTVCDANASIQKRLYVGVTDRMRACLEVHFDDNDVDE